MQCSLMLLNATLRSVVAWCVGALSLILSVQPAQAQAQGLASVNMEVVAAADVSPIALHEWSQALSRVGLSQVRMKTNSRRPSRTTHLPTPELIRLDSGQYQLTAILASNTELQLPGLTIGRSQTGKIETWFAEQLRAAAPRPPPKLAFGLTAEQLIGVHKTLGSRVGFNTAGIEAAKVARKICEQASWGVQISPAAKRALREDFTMIENLEGLAAGTALAAALRPLGLAITPQLRGSKLTLLIDDSQAASEFWPIGWPPEQKAAKLFPKMFEFIPIDLRNVKVLDALNAIGSRLELPILFDHNSLAAKGIELSEVRVTVPPKKTYYKKALDRVLYEAGTQGELRVDEQGRPFYWVSAR